MIRLIMVFVFIVLSISIVFASDVQFKDENITGQVIDVVNVKTGLFVNIKYQNNLYWYKIPRGTKVVNGKLYDFYPAYSIEDNYYNTVTKKYYKPLLYSFGIVDKRFADLTKYAFKGIVIGTDIVKVREQLSSMGFVVIDESIDSSSSMMYMIKGYKLGDIPFDVHFIGDLHNKLASYRFSLNSPNEIVNKEWLTSYFSFLAGIFKEKYGKPAHCQDLSQLLTENNGDIDYCDWRFGDIAIGIKYNNEGNKIMGSIMSGTRIFQTLNNNAMKRETLKKEIKSIKDGAMDEIIKKGASSY